MTRCLRGLFYREFASRNRDIVIRGPRPWFSALLALYERAR